MMREKNMVKLAISCSVACLVLILQSCDFPYQPEQFIPPPPEFTFISADSIKGFVGTDNVKIAFNRLSNGQIYYIAFKVSDTVKVLPKPAGKTGNSDSPIISPDGNWVTYFIANGPSDCQAFVQKLDPEAEAVQVGGTFATDPHWWTDSAGNSCIIYSNKFDVVQDQLTSLTGYATFKQKVVLTGSAAVLDGSPEQIADKPFNGGLSKDGKYLCTGYSDAAFFEIDSSKVIRVNSGLQICNPSITPDSVIDDQMMFLCFSGTQNMIGDPFGSVMQHQIIYVVDKSNTVKWSMDKPAEYNEWQDPEWSNNPGYAAALLGKLRQAKYEGVIIRLSDKATLNFMSESSVDKMDNTSTPYVWIGQ
jgi:hypothetical protein